ncbi:Nucleolar protein 12 [Lithohypha guttulata]|uniref:Nucleolar protein 12 n=1 Tax=Lithohypha guttulata TaxID=1690604 RepID=A0AAN7SXZ8_9EURO|nr:Nucleolar protein 12 [Lithohypha guttulata]
MAKTKNKQESAHDTPSTSTKVESSSFDPTLAALFASSSGPVTVPTRPTRTLHTVPKSKREAETAPAEVLEQTETSSNEDSEESTDDSEEESSTTEVEVKVEEPQERPKKRRKLDQNDDLESKYLDKLAREEEQEQKLRKKSKTKPKTDKIIEDGNEDGDSSDTDLNSGLEDLSDSDVEEGVKIKDAKDSIPKHESLSSTAHDLEAQKLKRTVFLGNVSNTVITSKSDKKALVLHLRSGIDTKHHEKIESIRFRSTAFVQDAGPKRAAYAKKELMDETMKSTNAYVVASSEAAARKLAARLNGTVVLNRHLRVDNLGAPSKIDNKRCVFVGNLSFVDEDIAKEEDANGETNKRKRSREPADAEEGLWQTFGKVGKVESVRVVRDKETRISKGFAYVQFQDENAVEAALLMDGKKFPPMLPRTLRVMRAKKDVRKIRSETRQPAIRRENGMDKGRSQKPGLSSREKTNGSGGKVILEGHRASSSHALPKGLKKMKKRPAVKPDNRGSRRAAAFRAGGGKKKRDIST